MKYTLLVLLLVFASSFFTKVSALPAKCLQAPSRVNACPHIIYKKAALAVEALEVNKGEVICLCLSDLAALNSTSLSKVEKIDQQVSFESLLKQYQLSEQDILTLISN